MLKNSWPWATPPKNEQTMTVAKHITAVLAAAVCTAAGAQQLSCTTPAIVKTVKLIFAENVIIGAEQEMAVRFSLGAPTSAEAMDKGGDNLAGALTLRNIRKLDSRGDGFFWCGGEINLNTAPQYSIPLEYRARASSDFKSGIQTQAAINFPKGITGFNLLIGMRQSLVAAIPDRYKTPPPAQIATDKAAEPTPPPQPAEPSVRPSFDCNQQYNQIKKMICASNTLAQLDLDEAELYKKAHENAKATLKQYDLWAFEDRRTQRMHKRNYCKDEGCLESVYIEWMKELEAMPH